MLKIMVLRKRHKKMLEEAEQLRSKISGFKSREADVAAQVEAASTDEEIAAAAAAVEELEKAQKSAKERLATIIEEAEALQQEIADAEAAASSAAGGDGGEDGGDEGEARSRRSMSPDFRRRCQDFQRTGKHTYRNAKSFVTRTAVLSSSTGVIGPTGVSGINDPVGNTISDFLDLIKITDCTGMASYKVAYIDFEFNGKTYALSFTAEALFTIYDKFGYTADILGTTHVLEPTLEGWKNCCWLAALMASQGELQRRHRGESPQQMLTLEELRTGFMAADSVLLRQAVRDALEQGFHRDIPKPDEDEEVNLVLLEREEAEKKARAAALRASISWLRRLFGSTSAPKKP